jgi:Cd2+/Zn2+-exporting ATPase
MNEEREKVQQSIHDTLPAEDTSCLEVVDTAVGLEPGILSVDLDPSEEQIFLSYDAAQLSEGDVINIAEQVTPALHQRWHTCTMQLGRQGGRACESCALALERQVASFEGVRRARASYRGGVLSINYDDQLISPNSLFRQVEALGVTVSPSSAASWAEPLRKIEAKPAAVTPSPLRRFQQ